MERERVGSAGKVELMKRFMRTFVGNGFYLIIREGERHLIVNSIGIVQKTDESCPIKEVPVGDFFFRLLARDEDDLEVSLLCNWSEQLIQNLLDNYALAKRAGFREIMLCKGSLPDNSNSWFIVWGNKLERAIKPVVNGKEAPFQTNRQVSVSLPYIS
ncbi:MAG: hypothetical protein ACE5GD_11135 [Candidatus Geothermarchaeales archaeon]